MSAPATRRKAAIYISRPRRASFPPPFLAAALKKLLRVLANGGGGGPWRGKSSPAAFSFSLLFLWNGRKKVQRTAVDAELGMQPGPPLRARPRPPPAALLSPFR